MAQPLISKRAALLLALFAVVVWGMSFAVTRAAVREIPPMALALLRFALAAGVLWPATRGCRVRIAREDRAAVLSLGLAGITFYYAFENTGLTFTTASHGALIIVLIPLATELVAARRHRRRPSPPVLAGLAAALGGVALIFGRDAGGGASLLGDLLMLGSVGCWVVYTFVLDHLGHRYPGVYLTFLLVATGTVTLIPLAVIEGFLLPPTVPSAAAWGGVAFLGLACSALAYLAWNRALPILGVTVTNALIYLIPLVGVMTGILALGEPFTWRIAVGGVLIVGGVAWAGWKSQKNSNLPQKHTDTHG